MSDDDKIIFRVTLTGTYSVSRETLKNAYGTTNLDEVIKIDQDSFDDDPGMFLDMLEDSTIKVELDTNSKKAN